MSTKKPDYQAKNIKISEESHQALQEARDKMCPSSRTPYSVVIRRLAENYVAAQEVVDA